MEDIPMVMTREQKRTYARTAYSYVLEELMDVKVDGIVDRALADAGCQGDIRVVVKLSDAEIGSLCYRDGEGENKKVFDLPVGSKQLVRIVKAFYVHQKSEGIDIDSSWHSITDNAFDTFRMDVYDPDQSYKLPSSSNSAPGSNYDTSSRGRSLPAHNVDPVRDFKRGIKRDPSLFTTLKNIKQWDAWYISLKAQARAQGVSRVLDPTYTPRTPGDVELFDQMQQYMYAVFTTILQTDKGKALVRENASSYNAQVVHRDLYQHAQCSTRSSVEAADLLTYITTARLGTGIWKGSTEAFIIHWQDQVRKYEQLVDSADSFSESVKRTMLENAVNSVDDLRIVKSQADQFQVRMGTPITYEQYSSLLQSASQTYDSKFSTRANSKGIRRSIYAHDLVHYSTNEGPDTDRVYDIDSDPALLQNNYCAVGHDLNQDDILQANKVHVNPLEREPTYGCPRDDMIQVHTARLDPQQWRALSVDAKRIWSQLDPTSRRIILREQDNKPPGQEQPREYQSTVGNPRRRIQFHESGTSEPFHRSHVPPDETGSLPSQTDQGDSMLACVAKRGRLPPGHVQRLLSPSMNSPADSDNGTSADNNEIVLNGQRYRAINLAKTVYCHSHVRKQCGALVDRGANGGICGSDVRVIARTGRTVDIQGIDGHQIVDIPIVTAGAVVSTQRGPVILVMHQYAYIGRGKTIHSSGQMEMFRNDVNDKSLKVAGGLQRICTPDGYCIPLNIKSGLPYMFMRPYDDREWDDLPHVIITSDCDWDPTVLDNIIDDDEDWYDSVPDLSENCLFDSHGNYIHRHSVNYVSIDNVGLEDGLLPPNLCLLDRWEQHYDTNEDDVDHFYDTSTGDTILEGNERLITPKEPEYNNFIPNFAWQSIDVIKRTFAATTQYLRIPMSTHLTRHFKSQFPALNVPRRHESVATDTVYADVPAVDCGHTQAQFYCGLDTHVCDVYGMKTDKQFVNTFEDIIRRRGAMDRLISDQAAVETSKRAKDILRGYVIGDWQSEAHQQQQNYAERRYQHAKHTTNRMMERTGSPAYTWLLALLYVVYLLNHTASRVLSWRTPIERLTGTTPDISPLLRFHWWQPVYYKLDDSDFPSDSREKRGRFVGISEHVGHALTYKILTDDTKRVIHRSNVRPADDKDAPNLRVDLADGESGKIEFIKSAGDVNNEQSNVGQRNTMMVIPPEDMIGRTFLSKPLDNGERHRGKIVRAIEGHLEDVLSHPERIKYVCTFNDEQYEEIMSYNDIVNHIESDNDELSTWKFKCIQAHEGPLSHYDKNYKGSKYNVMVNWETGETTWEPLSLIAADDPVSCTIYAKENNLLDKDGWKRFKGIAKRQKKLFRMANQAKLRSFRTTPKYKYGVQVPRNYNEAKRIDDRNSDTKWQDATALEMKQLKEYTTFINYGRGGKPPQGYKRIRVHIIYDVKHDGRYKARCVADGHLTDIPIDSVYSGVVSLRGLRIMIFLAELNQLETWATDVGNAYLEAETNEKVYIVAGPEFGDEQGCFLIIFKALYGLRSSGKCFHEKFADDLRSMGFFPCKIEPDIWMRKAGNVWEYVAVYVDDLAFCMKQPQEFIDLLTNKYHYKLKGTGEISFHLGCDFFRDKEEILCMAPLKYIEKMVDGYYNMFGEKPKTKYSSPLEKGDHPELDDSELLDQSGIAKYQSLIGSLQWAISLGRLDITTAVMTLSRFRSIPRMGHLDRAKRVVGYLVKFKQGAIRFRTGLPDYSDVHRTPWEWEKSVYGDIHEYLPDDAPDALGKPVILTHYVDANLYHDILTGRSVTGVLHFINQTPIEWFSKRQATAETATYGSEFIVARTCVEQIINIRNTLRYLGVRIVGPSHMFGDNKSVVDSSMRIDARLHKRHNALSFHKVRESIAASICDFQFLPGEFNVADVLSKHWSHACVWDLLRPVLFWQGDTAMIPDDK